MTEPLYRGMDTDTTFQSITLKPHWKQYIVGQAGAILLFIILLTVAMLTPKEQGWLWKSTGIAAVSIMSCLIYHIMDMSRMEFVITEEQIIFRHGLMVHSIDYLELYRVVDYQENRTALQQILGIKTLRVQSGDKNTPILDIIGLPVNTNIIPLIRERVEYNKTRRGVYEFTNR